MKRIDNRKNLYKSIILLIILAIGIGYAYLTSNLSITGSTEVVANTWNIHFENLNVSTGSVTATTPAAINANNVDITYAITLSRPKDYYEFTVDIKNDGTLPGKVSISSLSGLDATSSKVIDYSITYTNDDSVYVNDILNAGAKKTIKVRVFYKDEIDPEDFPANDLNLTLTYTLQYVQSEVEEKVENIIQNLSTSNSCVVKYEGQVTDKVGITEQANNVYFDKCENKRHVVFGGYCWEVIRTTETGGIKMLYNGKVVDGKCLSDRSNVKRIRFNGTPTISVSDSYLYGKSYSYDEDSGMFTLIDTSTAIWSDSTYASLLGKYTCLNNTGSCTNLYNINGYDSSEKANTISYTVGNIDYSLIGTSSYNANYRSLAMVGYMFNKSYNLRFKFESEITGTVMFSSSFNYDSSTNMYALAGTINNISDWHSNYNSVKNTRYTCWNVNGQCENISYIHSVGRNPYYIEISEGKGIVDILQEMLWSDNVNTYDSSIKGVVDAWYKQYFSSYSDKLEDAIYCNTRTVSEFGPWSITPSTNDDLYFLNRSNSNNKDLSCSRITDQFSVSNNKAKLTYPISLLSMEEKNNYGLSYGGFSFWSLSPSFFASDGAYSGLIYSDGTNLFSRVLNNYGVRPVISLKGNNIISKGTGSETDPWVID